MSSQSAGSTERRTWQVMWRPAPGGCRLLRSTDDEIFTFGRQNQWSVNALPPSTP